MTSEIAGVLYRAADLIEPEGAWTQNRNARDAFGNAVLATDSSAVCWCAYGAVLRESNYRMIGGRPYDRLLQALRTREQRVMSVSMWNDAPERTQAEAVQLLRDAAKLAERENA